MDIPWLFHCIESMITLCARTPEKVIYLATGYIGINRRCHRAAPDGNRPRLLKVRFASSLHRSLVLRKAKSLKNSPKYSKVYIRPCHSPAERKHISELYSALHDLKQKTGKDHYIDRRGPIKEWSVKMRIEKELSSATVASS